MKGQYGPYIKYKSLNATIPEEKDPTELSMEEALILIEKRKEYDKTKKKKKKKKIKKKIKKKNDKNYINNIYIYYTNVLCFY